MRNLGTTISSVPGAISSFFTREAAHPHSEGGGFSHEELTGGKKPIPPLFKIILNSKYELLNKPENLFQNNITVIYFLFELLRSYEISFISRQEDLNSVYDTINPTYILQDMLGASNVLPHNIELYVFLKLLLQDYNEENLKSINYALFEYYLYIFKSNFDIYYEFQTIKNYLDVNYRINITKDNIENINKNNTKSLQYFFEIGKKTREICKTIISEIFTAKCESNYDVIYQYVEEYSLKLRGFSDMQIEFINKTYEIIDSMASKGLLLQYTNLPVTEETKSFDDTTGTDRSSVEPVHDPIEVSKNDTPELQDVKPELQDNTPELQDDTPKVRPRPMPIPNDIPRFDQEFNQQPIAAYGGKKIKTSIRKNRKKIKKSRKHASRKHCNKKTLKKNRRKRRKTHKNT